MPFREIVANATEEMVPKLVTEAATSWAGPGIVAGGEQRDPNHHFKAKEYSSEEMVV